MIRAPRLTVGILECDRPDDALLGIAGDYCDMIRSLFSRSALTLLRFRSYDLTRGVAPDSVGECDAWLTTGSRSSVNDEEPWISTLREIVLSAHAEDRPYVGICFGHQILGAAFGGEVGPSARGWGLGVQSMRIHDHQPWMAPPRSDSSLLVSHREQITRPPPSARILAGSDFCPVGMMLVGETMLGIQGHPEFTPAYATALMLSRRAQFARSTLGAAMASTMNATDDDATARWVYRFFSERA